ncbi:Borealin N terminal-domain-containing protein [Daldinia caldariorum]|uniref:Borealin N terminal-domain-containing protein n=1 Tax=Daldinia caldariorum TaxID=326644 RepID=UPI00200812C5|nr:Borealin N terminal-domain-containing protein [Daldinia caldariorum]KAI1467335.1 Borealin N terminal-domain-containing protein [Daldinia caldariorum]
MAPVKPTRKRKSEAITGSIDNRKITMRSSPARSPIKKRKIGLSLAQKQALIDNLQLEITERARRLRAQYNIQAQQLRSRVEMRVNRIPTALRKLKMGELLSKSLQPQQPPRPPKSAYVARPPPVPPKDGTSAKPLPRKPVPATNPRRLSEEIIGLDKENQGGDVQNPKKRPHGIPGKEPAAIQPGQILSPTSSNTRIVPRPRPASPIKPLASRPASPLKGPPPKPSSHIISSMTDRVKPTRPAVPRKPTTSSTTSSTNGNASVRARQAAVPSRPPTAASTRGRRKASTASETSNGSSTTVVKKTTASKTSKTTAPAAKKTTVMNTIKSATTKKPPTTKAAATGTGTGRTLRKRA